MKDRKEGRNGRMARPGARSRSSPGRGGRAINRLRSGRGGSAALLIANILPIGAAVFLYYGYRTGKITFVAGSERIMPGLVLLALALAVLVFLSWIAAPLLMPAVGAVRDFIRRQRHEISRGGAGALVLRLPALVAGLALYTVLWINVAVLACLMAANVLAIIVFVVFLARDVMSVRG